MQRAFNAAWMRHPETLAEIHAVISVFFFPPTDAQVNCLKHDCKIHIKINIKRAPTCFCAVTPSPGSALIMLAKVTVVKRAN
jgi:hypothetical protein